jgi:tRNA/tmRNA/rRNA uracil-C5-methylase (TrmA/RlmC/RlmD family)
MDLVACVDRCPGCRHRNLPRLESESSKRDWIERQLRSELGEWVQVEKTEAPNEARRFQYRNKVCLRAQWDGRWKFGMRIFHRLPDSYDRMEEVIDIPSCPVHSERVRRIQRALPSLLPLDGSFPLLYLLISGAFLTLVLKSAREQSSVSWARRQDVQQSLTDAGVEGLFLNFNPSAGERVLSSRGWVHVWGASKLQDEQGFWYGPDSFRQLLPELHEKALHEAECFLNPAQADSVLDLYSGSGTSLRIWKARQARFLGVELGGEAIECAELNLHGAFVLRGRTSERLPQVMDWVSQESGSGRRLLFTNPPRLGMEPEVTEWIADIFRPDRIAYLSCSAGTLARDLSILLKSGYALRKVTPYDFFPGTHHVEALALVERLA